MGEDLWCAYDRMGLSFPISAGFLIGNLIEPVPAKTMRERYPGDYGKLSKEPGFLILRLLKPARPPD